MTPFVRRLGRSAARNACIGALVVFGTAHIGSPDVLFSGRAGAYDVSVVVRPPQVVPGLAEVVVRFPTARAADIHAVTIRPVFWATGARGSPRPDEAVRVPSSEVIFAGRLWFMRGGSYGVYVDVSGSRGNGSVSIPVDAAATAQLGLTPLLKAILVVLGVVLFFGMLTLVHAAAGEALTAPGARPDAKRVSSARRATAIALPTLCLLLLGGWRWWTAEATAYRRTLDRSVAATASVVHAPGAPRLRLEITDARWTRQYGSALIPDHGKMMHLFLVRAPTLDAFAHLHPVERDSRNFETALPDLPPGPYRVYADIVHESGYARTIATSVVIDAPGTGTLDADDAVDPAVVAAEADGDASLGGGMQMHLTVPALPVIAGRLIELRFQVTAPAREGTRDAVALEPYLGMPAHVVIMRDDGSVFIHLHPMGTISPAAQAAFALRDRGDTTAAGALTGVDSATSAAAMEIGAPDGRFDVPYEFPRAGRYRIFGQVRHAGRVLTGAFDLTAVGSR